MSLELSAGVTTWGASTSSWTHLLSDWCLPLRHQRIGNFLALRRGSWGIVRYLHRRLVSHSLTVLLPEGGVAGRLLRGRVLTVGFGG